MAQSIRSKLHNGNDGVNPSKHYGTEITSNMPKYDIELAYQIFRRNFGIIVDIQAEIKRGRLAKKKGYDILPSDPKSISTLIRKAKFKERITDELAMVEETNREIVKVMEMEHIRKMARMKKRAIDSALLLVNCITIELSYIVKANEIRKEREGQARWKNSGDDPKGVLKLNLTSRTAIEFMDALERAYKISKVELKEPTNISQSTNLNIDGYLEDLIVEDDTKEIIDVDEEFKSAVNDNPLNEEDKSIQD